MRSVLFSRRTIQAIEKPSRTWILASVLLMAVSACHRTAVGPTRYSAMDCNTRTTDQALTRHVVETLQCCPTWIHAATSNTTTRATILQCLDVLARQDTSVLRKAVEQFVFERKAAGKYTVDDMSKVFLLNRYVFNVPSKSKLKEARFFGGWVGIPCDETDVDLLWPLRMGDDGKWELAGKCGGYYGDVFEAIMEFDYFNQRFGRRRRE